MKKISTRILFELNEPGPEKLESYNLPFVVERLKYDNDVIIWFGYNTNWKFEDNQWYSTIKSEWIECETPDYEKMYLKNYQ